MDRLFAMQIFTRIVDSGSFTQAAKELNISRASATSMLKQLEQSLGVRLLHRTTRRVNPTVDGRFYYQRCRNILEQVSETEELLSQVAAMPRGPLRVDLPNSFSRLEVIPRLPEFCASYPDVELLLSAGDRVINLVEESVDCAIRIGTLTDTPSNISRPLTPLRQVTCASPLYLNRFGLPQRFSDFERHQCVEYRSTSSGEVEPLEFLLDGQLQQQTLPALISVSNGDSYVAACEAGMGIIQIPEYHIRRQLEAGTLVEILPDIRPPSLPLSVLYSHHSHMKPALRVFIDWMVKHF
ncbi:DNA-binding transcriptional regulator, LysR family [Amphritea atlantica]|uniref:DNA-binding transcriptional regulator, LysR family n=1 Tax=Amphritea atlantica TaxID=355243 RepID=A0A1H9FN70_9GAMM|nr:LysR family transcriptional regulator [Amphritea atlantica]SEQ39387.1 DNA-binding transcriptional regulator, LysR family [Amphritea atlantica]